MENVKKKLSWNKYTFIACIILIAGFVMRAWFIRTIPTKQLYDFDAYYRLAVNLFEGKGYTYEGLPMAFQSMFYSWSLGMLFKLVGSYGEGIAKWINVMYGMGQIFVSWRIARHLFLKRKNREVLGLVVMAFVAFLPQHIAYCNVIGTETQMGFLLSLMIWIQIGDLPVKYKVPLLGILSGVCTLAKPFYIAIPLIIALCCWLSEKQWKKALIHGVTIMLIMAVVVSPWTIRNYYAFGRFIPVSYNSGFNLYINNNAQNVHGGWMDFNQIEKSKAVQDIFDRNLDGGKRSIKVASDIEVELKPFAIGWIKSNPVEFLKLGLIRIHSTYFNGSWDVDAWSMNELREKPTKLSEYELSRNFNAFRALNDMLLSVLSAFSFIFVLVGIPNLIKALFLKKKKVALNSIVLFMQLAFPSLVFFVYEGQPRYNHSLLFIMICVVVSLLDGVMSQFQFLEE